MLKKIIQKALFRLGFQIIVLPPPEEIQKRREDKRRAREWESIKDKWLIDLQIKTILDIGANTGQFAQAISTIFPNAIIYSFEPLSDCYKELVKKFESHQNFQALNIALSNKTETTQIYRNQYSPSSSLLPISNIHKDIFPQTCSESVEVIETICLDDIAKDLRIDDPVLIKIDVQGFEDRVIAGGINLISRAKLIIIEMSMEALYEGQPLFDDIYQTLTKLGFQYRGNYEQLYSPQDGRILQVDGIFMK
jgi:FkbM family methyltransferase